MVETLRKVKPDDPLAIPAATFNAFVDAAQDYRNRQHRQERPIPPADDGSGTIRVKNASGADRVAPSPPRTGISVGEITGISKKGLGVPLGPLRRCRGHGGQGDRQEAHGGVRGEGV